ncbi:MAG: toprim domain-containing protein, partial [Chloroflexi bacterium]|nr:toprim domain-containing protein [Chloroflexota bacterium]
AVIVEGYMDVVIAHQYGFANAVASLGTAITDKQITILKRLTSNVVLALDADSAGEEAMLRCVTYENSLDSEIRVVVLPAGKDPDEVIKQDTALWQRLLQEALPVIDYTFEIVASQLDLTQAKDKVSAVDKLLPIVAEIQNPVRQAHYLQKLSRLVRVSERSLETTLIKSHAKKNKYSQSMGTGRNQKPVARAVQSPLSNTIEEHCLALLLKHPELKDKCQDLLAEYFENSENREIFITWRQTDNLSALKDNLDSALWEHLDKLVNKEILANQTEQRYNNYVLRLREEYFRGVERKREAVFALEAETGGSGADLAKLKEEGIEPSMRLGEIFAQKARKGQ